MTKIQFYKLYKKLKAYKTQYNVPDENFQKIFMERITQHLSCFYGYYYDNSKVETMCKIIINCLLTTDLDFLYLKHLNMKNADIDISDIFGSLNAITHDTSNGLNINFNDKYIQQELKCIIEVCISIIDKLGYDTYKCLDECIKAYTSHEMVYSEFDKKWQQEHGAVSLSRALAIVHSEKYKDKLVKNTEETDTEYIFTLIHSANKNETETVRIKKNYIAKILPIKRKK